MKKVAYYPGCALKTIDRAYDDTSKYVAGSLGFALEEIGDYNCCGIGELKSQGEAGLMLPARNLMLAKEQFGAKDLVMSCSVCYHELARANTILNKRADEKEKVNDLLRTGGGSGYEGDVEPRHIIEFLFNEVGVAGVKARVKKPLAGLKVAPYYGCLYSRPSVYTGTARNPRMDDAERPRFMHALLEACGATTVSYGNETSCCGGRSLIQDEDTSFRLIYDTLSKAKAAGADVVALICPKCAGGLDIMQENVLKAAEKRESGAGKKGHIPIVYATQLIGLAFGASAGEMKLRDMETGAAKVLSSVIR